jgi:hypothetical protein
MAKGLLISCFSLGLLIAFNQSFLPLSFALWQRPPRAAFNAYQPRESLFQPPLFDPENLIMTANGLGVRWQVF